MAIRRRTNLVRAKSDRQMVWVGLDLDEVAVGANTAVLASTLNAAALALRPFTIVRTRYEILWISDQLAATEQPHGAYGQIVVSEEAAAAGAASVPDPIGQSDAAWFVFEPLIVRLSFGNNTGFSANAGFHQRVDSKAMRKVGNNDQVISVVTNSDTAAGAQLSVTGRLLVKLH